MRPALRRKPLPQLRVTSQFISRKSALLTTHLLCSEETNQVPGDRTVSPKHLGSNATKGVCSHHFTVSKCQDRTLFTVTLSYPYTDLDRPLWLHEFTDNRQMKVARSSVLHTGRLYPQETSQVLLLVAESAPRATVRPEGLIHR